MNEWMDERESFELLGKMFPLGVGGADVMRELCPDGWRASSLRLAIHPTPEQKWKEHCQIQENITSISKKPAPPTDRDAFFKEIREEAQREPEPDAVELGHLVGLCLWDILSNNHDLIFPNGDIRYMGSFRMVGGILSDFIAAMKKDENAFNRLTDISCWDLGYMDDYMGTIHVSGRTDLSPIYRLIFNRLKTLGYGWKYSFPRLCAFRLSDSTETQNNMETYNPSEAFGREQEEKDKEAAHRKLQEDLENIHRKALEDARDRPPPETVSAFRDVYGHWPQGWPPWLDSST